MIPIVTPVEMAAIDHDAPEGVEVLIERAGAAVARRAIDLLGGTYGRTVVVLVGPGNNGADGRDAARRLERRGVRCTIRPVAQENGSLPRCDMVIDAAFGTGLSRPYAGPGTPPGALRLAVDIPSGVDGLTGQAIGSPVRCDATVTFGALKPGLLFGPGRVLAGDVEVADIGLDVSRSTAALVAPVDAMLWRPRRSWDAHKWNHATWVVAGSPGMTGAAALAASGALRAGASYVRVGTPGSGPPAEGHLPVEAVAAALPKVGWADVLLADDERFASLVIGPGLGRDAEHTNQVRRVLSTPGPPVVVDADALAATAGLRLRRPAVLTPHDGEFARLVGGPPGADRLGAAREAAARFDGTVLLKGPTTVVARPDGRAWVVAHGDERLATAGSGDVLSGVIGAHLALGLPPDRAAAAAAALVASAAVRGPRLGLLAGDLPGLLAAELSNLSQQD